TGHKKNKHRLIVGGDTNVLFTGTRIVDKEDTSDYHHITIGGYVSSYYAHYSDETSNSGFVQFPTMAARNNQFGLNVAQVSMTYRSSRVRSNITLHYGDIPESTWPKTFNLIQEAHAGIKLVKHLWLDAGFFRTHIGLESVQPRENVTSSMAVTTFYDPYYLSGAKLSYELSPKLVIQLNAFNGYNTYIDNNKNKALGFSAMYDPNDNISVTYNFMTCDETPDNTGTKHQRFVHDLYASFKLNKLSFGFEANYISQNNSLLKDTLKSATLLSGLLVAKYQFIKKLAVYGRGEYFSDPDRILTGTLDIGKSIFGGTFGIEYHPLKNASISAETRFLQASNLIFRQGSTYTNQRYEYSITMDVWF
ncbi:MAG: outer membrane beta-barrel protein, partial [Bacteroidia bacterium]